MSIKEKLQIILITYNREKHAKHMLETLLAADAPTRELNILVLDNNSTDGTATLVKNLQAKHPNLSYHKNHYNIGLGGNIARALEMANQEYLWLLGDDDKLHFEAWPDLEKAIEEHKDLIAVARYVIPAGQEKDVALLLIQMSFISACVFKTSLFTDTIMTNVINNIYTLFPHLAPIVSYLNHHPAQGIYLLPRALSSNGMDTETDCSYIRGYDNEELYLKQRSMSWIVGYANILFQIKDKKLLYHLMEIPMGLGKIHAGWCDFYQFIQDNYALRGNWLPIFETLRTISPVRRLLWWIYLVSPVKFYFRNKALHLCLCWFIKTRIWRSHQRRSV